MGAWSIIEMAQLHEGLDFDAEHYHPDRSSAWTTLTAHAKKVVSNFAVEIEDLRCPDSLRPSFDLTAAISQFLDFEGTAGATSTKKIAMPGDVIVSRLRSYLREVCLLPERGDHFEPQLSTEFIVLRALSKESAAWLVPFILSKPVQTVLRWSQTGSNHPRFSARTLLNMPVVGMVEKIIPRLNTITTAAVREFERSVTSYPEAQAELLDRLKWNGPSQPAHQYFSTSFSASAATGRWDAEHFRPEVRELIRTH